MRTEIITLNNQEYICILTNDINEGDFIIKIFNPIDKPIEISINKVVYINRTTNIFRYDKISGQGNHNFGIDQFTSDTDLSKIYGRKLIVNLDILHRKIIGIGLNSSTDNVLTM